MLFGAPAVVFGPTARLRQDLTWEALAQMGPAAIREADAFPYPALPHPKQSTGGQVFPDVQIRMFPRLRRFDVDFDVPEAFREAPPTSANGAAAVPWRWRGQHVGTFGEIAPTGGVVDVSGVTLVLDDGSQLIRVVDWLTLYRQMGMMMVCRRPRHSHADDPQREETFDTTDIP